ncbi:MAG: dTDP-4-dehydrorhamnose reductase [Bacteroidetes bacterium]|nr:dTDP-4-dehydrorhamnose reductase [Bacteroidota bacterium]
MLPVPTILITGAKGQLGNEFRSLAASFPQYHFLFTDRETLAIDDADAVKKYFEKHSLQYCINCAAYTAVDKAETEQDKAFAINAVATGLLAAMCKQYHTQFIHISTDYVFDGNGTVPYQPSSTTHPVNTYGASKLKGEQLALQENEDSIIIRTSWVYSSFGNNFVKTMLRLMKERESLNVVNDQQGCPTYAADLAHTIMQMIEKGIPAHQSQQERVFHYSNEGVITWYDFAVAIQQLSNLNCTVHPIPTSQYPTPAKRPHYSVMDTTSLRNNFGIRIPFWKDSLKTCLSILLK